MPDDTDTDLTLPSVVASLSAKYCDKVLRLTVIFHPQTSRIGQTAVVSGQAGDVPWVLGRRSPAFSGGAEQVTSPLDDAHVSRQALEFLPRGKQLLVRRFDGSSRCRIAGCELDESAVLEPEQLHKGVALMLGHTVVLLLRYCARSQGGGLQHVEGDPLRGSSAYMGTLREQIMQAAGSDLGVLVRGETGTGKELVATAIHRASRRAAAPLVSVNMAAIPVDLAAAALFGNAQGAFTGANKAGTGYFEQAQGGSLFLDEIGDTPAAVQPQLLRALQEREIQAVGGPVRRVDVRVISATDAALEGECCDFKAALRHRLGACEILLLPLREHPEDIGELLLYFLATAAAQAQRGALLPHEHSSSQEIAAWAGLFYSFVCHSWSGNVRELANFANQVVLASETQPILPDHVRAALEQNAGPRRAVSDGPRRRKMQEVSELEFDEVMLANAFVPALVERQLGVSRTSVYRRIGDSPRYRLAGEVPGDELQQVLAEHGGDCTAAALHLRVSPAGLRARLRQLKLDGH